MNRPSLTHDQVVDLQELLEDSISFFCDEQMISGEAAWTVTKGFATLKLEQIGQLP